MLAAIQERRRTDPHPSIHSLPENGCDLVRDALVEVAAKRVIEVGLGYGRSALAIAEALWPHRPDALHLIIDPCQDQFEDAGWKALEPAHGICVLHRERSQAVLPRFVEQGLQVDAAFVDGSHAFHDVFVDFYYLSQIVKPGGLLIADDLNWPGVAGAVKYFLAFFGWQVALDAKRVGFFRLPDPAPDLTRWEV